MSTNKTASWQGATFEEILRMETNEVELQQFHLRCDGSDVVIMDTETQEGMKMPRVVFDLFIDEYTRQRQLTEQNARNRKRGRNR